MNAHLYAVFNNVLHNTREAIPFILDYFSLDLEVVHLQVEYIKHYIQYITSDYIVNIPTPNTNLLDTTDDTIEYIKAFLQPHHSYP